MMSPFVAISTIEAKDESLSPAVFMLAVKDSTSRAEVSENSGGLLQQSNRSCRWVA